MKYSKIKFVIFPALTLIFFICRNFLHYILLLADLEKIAGYLVFPNNSGILFDILLGIFLAVIDHYVFKSECSKGRTLGHLFQVFFVLAVLALGLCVFPYGRVNELLGEKILYPIFSLVMQSGLLEKAKNMDIEILRDNFYWHFVLDEITFIEWIVTYLVFQGCTQIAYTQAKLKEPGK